MKHVFSLIALWASVVMAADPAVKPTTGPSTQPGLTVYDSTYPRGVLDGFPRIYTAAGIPTDSIEPAMVSREYVSALVDRAKADGSVAVILDCEQLVFHWQDPPGLLTYSPTNPHDRKVLNSTRKLFDAAKPLCRDAGLDYGCYGFFAPATGVVNTEQPLGQAEALKQRQLFLNIQAGGYKPKFVSFCGYANPGTLAGGFERWKKYYHNEHDLAAGIGEQVLVFVWPFQDGCGEFPPEVPVGWWTAELEEVKKTGDPVALWGMADPKHPEYGVITADMPHVKVLKGMAK